MKLFYIILVSYTVLSDGTAIKDTETMGPVVYTSQEACEVDMNTWIVKRAEEMPDFPWAMLAKCKEVPTWI